MGMWRDSAQAVMAQCPHRCCSELLTSTAAIELTDHLPVISLAIEVPAELSGDYGAWVLMSKKGLYAYDWLGHHGPYRRIAVPTVPLRTADLPQQLLDAAELFVLPLSFAEAVDVRIPYANERG
jgi:hypothetical protein